VSTTALAPVETKPPVRLLTTGKVAKICQVAPRTVSKWFDAGRQKGFRLPGSKDRRIYADDFVEFLKESGYRVPADLVEPEAPAVVVVYALSDVPVPGGLLVAADALALGSLVTAHRVAAVVLGDDDGLAAALRGARLVREKHPQARIIFALSPDVSPALVAEAGFGDCEVLARPEARGRIPLLLAG
jgi:hypothetical protein